MTFPAPHFIQNRNHFRAASPIRRGWPVKAGPAPSTVVETTSATDAVIGIADVEASTGDVVEIAWIGFVDVALAGAALGAEVRLAADGSPTAGGDGRFIGIAGGASFGGYTVTRLGLLGYLPASGGGGGGGAYSGWVYAVVEEGDEYHIAPEDFGKNIFVAFEDTSINPEDITIFAPSTAAGCPLLDAPVGTSVTFAIAALEPGGIVPVALSPAPTGDEVEVLELSHTSAYTLTRVDGSPPPFGTPAALLFAGPLTLDHDTKADDVEYTPTTSGDWDNLPDYVKGALNELAARVRTLENP